MATHQLSIHPNVYYTVDETAAMLRVPRRSIVRLLTSGRARGIRIGRQWRVLGQDLLDLPADDELSDIQLTRSLMRLAEPAFMKVWDNEEDAVYDSL